MKIGKKQIAALLLVLTVVITSCDTWLFDDRDGCELGVYVHLYSKTPCQTDTVYPKEVKQFTIYTFDERAKLASIKRVKTDGLSSNNRTLVPLLTPGMYSVIAWAGVTDDVFTESSLRLGETKKEELLLKLKESKSATLNPDVRVYNGMGEAFLVGTTGLNSYFVDTQVNLREISNRIKISVEGIKNPEDYAIEIESKNGAYAINGDIVFGESIHYQSFDRVIEEDAVSEHFTTLKLLTGYNSVLTIKKNEEVLYQEDLLGTLLLKNPLINLACDNDFVVKFKARESCQCVEIWVNNWLIHSYETELGI